MNINRANIQSFIDSVPQGQKKVESEEEKMVFKVYFLRLCEQDPHICRQLPKDQLKQHLPLLQENDGEKEKFVNKYVERLTRKKFFSPISDVKVVKQYSTRRKSLKNPALESMYSEYNYVR